MLNHDMPNGRWSRAKLACAGFALIGAALLIFEHRVHVQPYLPWLFLLACPLMHLFHGHGHQHGSETQPNSGDKP